MITDHRRTYAPLAIPLMTSVAALVLLNSTTRPRTPQTSSAWRKMWPDSPTARARDRGTKWLGATAVVSLATVATVATLASAAALDAHDFWLVPNAFAFPGNAAIEVSGRIGARFPDGESTVTQASVVTARIIGAGGETRITDLTIDGKLLRFRQKPSQPGQYLVAVRLKPRSTRTTQAAFLRDIGADGAADDAARLGREPVFGPAEMVTYRSTRYATTIVDVGVGPRVFGKSSGDGVEFIPASDPSRLSVGDTLRFHVMSAGHPNPGLEVHAGPADRAPRGSAGSRAPEADLHLVTDTEGTVDVPVSKPGLWNVRTVRVFLVSPKGRDGPSEWEVTWVTYVFSVGGRTTTPK